MTIDIPLVACLDHPDPGQGLVSGVVFPGTQPSRMKVPDLTLSHLMTAAYLFREIVGQMTWQATIRYWKITRGLGSTWDSYLGLGQSRDVFANLHWLIADIYHSC